VVAGLIQRRLGFRTLMVTVTLALVASVASATALTGRVAMAVPLAVGIFLAPSANVALFGRLAATTPDEIQARVISVVILAATGAAAVAPLGAGLLVDHVTATAAMLGCTAAVALSALAAMTARGLRELAVQRGDEDSRAGAGLS